MLELICDSTDEVHCQFQKTNQPYLGSERTRKKSGEGDNLGGEKIMGCAQNSKVALMASKYTFDRVPTVECARARAHHCHNSVWKLSHDVARGISL